MSEKIDDFWEIQVGDDLDSDLPDMEEPDDDDE